MAWLVSVAAVLASGAVAAREGHWRRRPGLDLGFRDHGGMWGDLLLLPVVNALIVPWVDWQPWLLAAGGVALGVSLALHTWWHGGQRGGVRDHLWPTRPTGRWMADLSWAGWCHVLYVVGELTLLLAFVGSPMPVMVTVAVAALLAAHVTLGLLQPGWNATGRIVRDDLRLLGAALTALSVVMAVKLWGNPGW